MRLNSRTSKAFRLFAVAVLFGLLINAAPSERAHADTYNVAASDVAGLIAAINAANANPGPDIVNLTSSTYSPWTNNPLPQIASEITINGNGATIYGGIFSVTTSGILILNDLTLLVSRVTNQGGTVTIYHSVLTENVNSYVAATGGAVFNSGTMQIHDSVFSNNRVVWSPFPFSGGAIFNAGALTITNSTFSGNSAGTASEHGAGGAIHNDLDGELTITGSLFINNTAGGGGAITSAHFVNISNSTFSGNQANTGGGINLYYDVRPSSLSFVTITNNSASAGGGVSTPVGAVNISNSIVTGNTASGDTPDCLGTLISQGYNVIGNMAGCAGITDGVNGDRVGIDPLLGPLADNGGPTMTHALLPGSPAINFVRAASCAVTTDQRGVTRPYPVAGSCDAGAYEYNGPDMDGDGLEDGADNCPFYPNPDQADLNNDGIGDVCTDSDSDEVLDLLDNCPLVANTDQTNSDGDGEGDACDADDDNDTLTDASDNCPTVVNVDQINTDGDSQGNACDFDDDDDTVADTADNCPLHANADQADSDGDGAGNVCESSTPNVIATVAAGDTPVSVAVNSITHRVYVANRNSNNITVIDGRTNTVITSIAVANAPLAMAVNPTTNSIYVVHSQNSNISVLDGATNTLITTVHVADYPRNVAVNPITNHVYATSNQSSVVSVIDGTTNTLITVIYGVNSPTGIAVNPVANLIYVTNWYNNTVTVIDGATDTILGTPFSIGSYPDYVTVDSSTNRIYVVRYNIIRVFHGTTYTPVALISTPSGCYIQVNSTVGHLYVANWSSDSGSGTVNIRDTATYTPIATTNLSVGEGPIDIGLNPVLNRLYVVSEGSNLISVIQDFPYADGDGDGIADAGDNCPLTVNLDQLNNDNDTEGDVCDTDDDNDTVSDGSDNCPLAANTDQLNTDGDAEGNACDTDDDNDTVADASDNCPLHANVDQADLDGDGIGDVCDDSDGDGVINAADNCPYHANPGQEDSNGSTDGDNIGDACENLVPCSENRIGCPAS